MAFLKASGRFPAGRFPAGRFPCAICDKLIRSNGRKLICSLCNFCYHFNCTSLTLADYKYFKSSSLGWTCQICSQSTFPFHSIEDNELVKLSYNSNLSCLCSKNSVNAILEDLPVLQYRLYQILVIFHTYLILTLNPTHLPKLILITLIYINFTVHLKLIVAQTRHFHSSIVI